MSNMKVAIRTVEHQHHWLIEEANGPLSKGVCKHCGAEREFKNWLADGDFITNNEHRMGIGYL